MICAKISIRSAQSFYSYRP